MTTTKITVEALVNAPISKVWNTWIDSDHITRWNSPSPEWHTPRATHNVVPGGNFTFRMEARDGSMGFDFGGVYDEVKKNELITSTLGDGRKVEVKFTTEGDKTRVVETFDAENENPVEMQRAGWQAIMDSFKNYTENLK